MVPIILKTKSSNLTVSDNSSCEFEIACSNRQIFVAYIFSRKDMVQRFHHHLWLIHTEGWFKTPLIQRPGYDVIMEVVLMEDILYQLTSVENVPMSTGCRISHFNGIMGGHDGTGN